MPIQVHNHSSGDTLTYSLALLNGEITPTLPQGIIVVYNALDQCSWPVHNGSFKAVVQLYPGENEIHLETGEEHLVFCLRYEVPCLVKFVRPIYIVCADDDGEFQGPDDVDCSVESACHRITLGTKLLQTFTAEKLHEHNLDRKTFALECEVNPTQPSCHVYRSKLKLEQAYNMSGGDLWMYFAKELMSSKEFDNKDSCKWFAFMSFTRYVPPAGLLPRSHSEVLQFTKGHTALGGGGLALFGTGTLHTWATTVEDLTAHFTDTRKMDRARFMDDSAYREYYWANYSTGLGASLHELGHTFDLAHTPTGVMARGFDDIYRVFTVQPLVSRRGSMCGDMSRTASPIPYSPRQSPIHTARKRVNSSSESGSRSSSPLSSPHFSTLPRTRSRTNSGSSIGDTMACNNNTFQIETDFKKLTVQTTQSFTIKNYDGSETKKLITKYRDGMESVAEITSHLTGEQVIQEVIKNITSGKSRTVLSMTSVPDKEAKNISSQISDISISVTIPKESTSTLSHLATKHSTHHVTTENSTNHVTTLSQVTNGIPTPTNSNITTDSDDISTQNESDTSDSEISNIVNNSNTVVVTNKTDVNNTVNVAASNVIHKTTNTLHITTLPSPRKNAQSMNKIILPQGKRDSIHQFRPRRKDGGAHWYRSSAIILNYHRWFNETETKDESKPPEIQGNVICSSCGLRLIELRSMPEGVVVHHWEFQAHKPPQQYVLEYETLKMLLNAQHFTMLVLDDRGHVVKKKMVLDDLKCNGN